MTPLETLKPLPIDFILRKSRLSWREALWGFEKGWLRWKSLIELAKHQQKTTTESEALDTLARCGKDQSHEVGELATALALAEGQHDEKAVKAKWQHLIVSQIYEQKHRFDDYWRVIDEAYEDFDYPPDMDRFVSYTEECRELYKHLVAQSERNPDAALKATMLTALESYIQQGSLRFGIKTNT